MLDLDVVRAHLDNGWLGAEVRSLGSVTSTNDIAWAWAEAGCPEGTVVFAEEQIQGRGRFGRRWECPRGRGVLMSVVLRPPTDEVGPAHVAALGVLATAEAIDAATGLAAAIQWPNDVTVGGRKVAGALVERRGADRGAPCVLGIGLNVNTRPEEFAEAIRESATSLAAEAGRDFSREALAGAMLRHLARGYHEALEGRWTQVASRWRRRCPLMGQVVTAHSRGRQARGRVVEIDPLGTIEMELPGGERRVFRAAWTSLTPSSTPGTPPGARASQTAE